MFHKQRMKSGTSVPVDLQEVGKAWRKENTLLPLDKDAKVVFLIPLISKKRSKDWGVVEANLRVTLKSLVAQTNPNWEAWICGQDMPNCTNLDDRVRFFKYSDQNAQVEFFDKGPKMELLKNRLFECSCEDGYVFFLDADDILHPELVDYFLMAESRSGYILPFGYIRDVNTGELGDFGYKSLMRLSNRPFFKHCGSCSAIRIDRRCGKNFESILRFRGKHGDQLKRLAYFGMKLADVPFHACIYNVNHGENMREKRGKLDEKIKYLKKNIIKPKKAELALREFNYDRLIL